MHLIYCDLLINTIKSDLAEHGFFKCSNINYDLHPKEGFLQSTTKTMEVVDDNGRKYMVTVETVD